MKICVNVLLVITSAVITSAFKFQPKIYNGCHDVSQKSLSLDDIVIVIGKRHELIFGSLLKMKLKANKKCWSKQKMWTAMITKNYYLK